MTNYYKVRTRPRDIDRWDDFKRLNVCATGWPAVPKADLLTRAEIRKSLEHFYQDMDDHALDLASGYIYKISHSFNISDRVVIVKDINEVVLAEVTGNYRYDPKEANIDLSHQVPVSFIRTVKRSDLSEGLRKSINSANTISSLQPYAAELNSLFESQLTPIKQTVTATYSAKLPAGAIQVNLTDSITESQFDYAIKMIKSKHHFD